MKRFRLRLGLWSVLGPLHYGSLLEELWPSFQHNHVTANKKKRKQFHCAIRHNIIPVSLEFLKLVSIFLFSFCSYLHNNRWDCKCSSRGLLTLLKKHKNIKLGSAPAICHRPFLIKGKRIDQECGKPQLIPTVNFYFLKFAYLPYRVNIALTSFLEW